MIRLFTPHPLSAGAALPLDEKQSHYLRHVMRQNDGDEALLFNGQHGEWRATLNITKKSVLANVAAQTREQNSESPLTLIFAPIKRGHGDMVIEKASELGATALYPIITDRTIVSRIPVDRYEAIAIEAAEQCERLSVPQIHAGQKLDTLLKNWAVHKPILWCAERGATQMIAQAIKTTSVPDYTVLIGPEGGFSDKEYAQLHSLPFIVPVTLGSRILRADTAAIAALSIVQALRGL